MQWYMLYTHGSCKPFRQCVTFCCIHELSMLTCRKGTVSVRVVNQGGPKFTSHGEVIGDTEIDYVSEILYNTSCPRETGNSIIVKQKFIIELSKLTMYLMVLLHLIICFLKGDYLIYFLLAQLSN